MNDQNQRVSKTFIIALVSLLTALSNANAQQVLLNGAGATFPYPIYSKWFSTYSKVDTSVQINYQSIGSGGGIRQLLDKTVDFGASDAPMSDEQLAKATAPILHIPTVLGAVVLTYNLPGLTQPLKLSGDVIADMFLGKISKWNDARLAGLNPGVNLPDTPIMIAHRSDGSGTTAIFSDYLKKISPEWEKKVGAGTALKWPVGLGGKGNEGVTGLIKQTPGSLGYVELIYAESNKLPAALIKNKAGNFVAASPKAVTAAAAGSLKAMPKDFRVSITNPDGKDAYPLSAFTYLLVYQTMDATKGPKFTKFLDWAMTEGQKMAEGMSYAPLPPSMLAAVKEKTKTIKIQ